MSFSLTRRALSATLALLALTGAAHAVDIVDFDPGGTGGTPGPDLIVENLGPDRITVAYGEPIPFEARVRNIGEEPADESCLTLRAGRRDIAVLYTPPLDPGESDTRDGMAWNDFQPGTYSLRMCADGTAAVAETPAGAERNNCVQLTVEVAPPPLLVEWLDLRVTPAEAAPGERLTVTARTRNAGSASAAYPVRFTLGGQTVAEKFCPALLGDEPCEMSFTVDAPHAVGAHALHGVADGEWQSADFTVVGPRPNLVITPDDLRRSVVVPRAGQAFRVEFAVRNAGSAAVDERFTVDLYLDDARVHSTTCHGLPVGGRCTRAKWFTLPAGQHTFRVVADAADVVVETHEDDNTRFMSFGVDAGGITCAGTWILTGDDGWQARSPGYVQDDCAVYWSANSPYPGVCMQTVGDGGLVARWHRHPITGCPYAADVTGQGPDGEPVDHHFTVRID